MSLPFTRACGVLLLLLVGCAHSHVLRERAAFDLGCPESSVDVSTAGEEYRASGCGRAADYACRTANMQSRCKSATEVPAAPADEDIPSGFTPEGAALNRAVVDLGCAEEQLSTVGFDSGSIGVRGCGKRIAYVCRDRFWRYRCEADSPIRADAAP